MDFNFTSLFNQSHALIMKRLSLLLLLLGLIRLACAQQAIVSVSSGGASWNGRPLMVNGTIGQRTSLVNLRLENRTGAPISILIHTHSRLQFVYFMDDAGRHGREITVNIPAYNTYSVNIFCNLPSGSDRIYNDDLGLDVSDGNGITNLAYVEVPISMYLYNSPVYAPATPPAGYRVIMAGGLPARWRMSDLPLTIYSNHTMNGFSSDLAALLQRSVYVWNTVGNSIGISAGFFRLVDSPTGADIKIDWSGEVIRQSGSSNALGIAYPQRNVVGMWPANVYRSAGQACEVLCQELCHLLGPEHSNYSEDIMHGVAHGHFHGNLAEVSVTERDRQALHWLYTQSSYYPFYKQRR